ncbi:MAG: sulfatase-like hydrolase/transferase [Puniceicoccales bacterium]
MPQPNILLITTDQQRFDHLGIAGLKGIGTPNLDRLATEGMHFKRAYCPSPICTPTRLSLLTGLYPSTHGGYSIGVSPDLFPTRTIPAELSQNGYRTGIIGKTHFVARPDEEAHMAGGMKPPVNFFREWVGPYCGFDYIQGSTGHTINHIPGMHYRTFLEDAGVDYQEWFPQMGPDYHHGQCGPWNIPQEFHDTHWVTDRTKDFIKKSAGKPWFCWASYQDPHEPFVCPEPWYSSVDTDSMEELPGFRKGEFDDKPEIYQRIFDWNIEGIDDGIGIPCVFSSKKTEEEKRNALQATLGMIAFLDYKLGELLDTLAATGQLDNTLVVFTSDHGEMHGHHGLWGKGLTAFEDCQRVPLLIWGPNLLSKKGPSDALVSLIDLPSTFLSLAGIKDYPHIQGQDLTPIFQGNEDSVQDSVVVECRANQQHLNQVTLITTRYKLIITKGFALGELYDLELDPNQYENLWERESHQTVRLQLLETLARKRMEAEPAFSPRTTFG